MSLGLGTVQFGLDYGVTNRHGQVPAAAVRDILDLAADAGVDVIDTAAAYGTAEAVLGQMLPAGHAFRLVTKVPPQTEPVATSELRAWLDCQWAASQARLAGQRVFGLLSHRPDELLGPTGEIFANWLLEQRARGTVDAVGVSVYSRADIDALYGRYPFDLIQLPMNVLDQRLLQDGTLDQLRRQGVEIHIRSAFLQGLLLAPPPARLASLPGLSAALAAFQEAARALGLSPATLALGFLRQACSDAALICGTSTPEEWRELLEAYRSIPDHLPDLSALAVTDGNLVDPTQWPR